MATGYDLQEVARQSGKDREMNGRTNRSVALLLSVLVLVSGTASALANSWWTQNPAQPPGIPDNGWVVQEDEDLADSDGYCGYVAAANILQYWDANGAGNLIPDGTTAEDLMIELKDYLFAGGTIAGTTCDELEDGLRDYLEDQGYGELGEVRQLNPPDITLDAIQQALRDGQQLAVGLPNHWVTAAGWYTDGDGTHLGVHDPNAMSGGQNFGGSTDYYPTRVQDGNLQMYYYGTWGTIDNLVTVKIMPEPLTLFSGAVGLWSVWGYLRRRKGMAYREEG